VAHGVGLADILREHGQPYLDTHTLPVVQSKAWRAIVSCRTPALGGHVECCDHCGVLRYRYHSCRNRHCPQWHIHVHALVTGGALAVGGKWVGAKRGFLLPVKALSAVYRASSWRARRARKAGILRHDAAQDDASWRMLVAALRRHDWVVYAKQPLGGPAQALEYLGATRTGSRSPTNASSAWRDVACASGYATRPTATARR